MKRALLVLLLVNLMLSACAPASAPTPIPSVTPAPTATPVPASTATPTSTPTSLPTNTPTPTSIPTPTTTPTLIPTFTLSGVVFFDYNGNGIRDEGEPPIPSAKVQVGSLTATAGPDGSYTLKRVPQGRQQVRLSAPGFRYTSLSVEAFQPVERPVAVTVEKDTRCDWGLMQGFLTLPFRGNYKIDRMYDHQPGKEILWWNGPHQCEADDNICYAVPPGTNEHPGIDYRMPEGTPVYAAAPGLIRFIDECNGVTI